MHPKGHMPMDTAAFYYGTVYCSFLLSKNIFIMDERGDQCKVFFAYFVTDRDAY
jgi:hypothetical protein